MKKKFNCPHCNKVLNFDGGYYRGLGIGSIKVGNIFECCNEDCEYYGASYHTVGSDNELHKGCPY